MSKTNTIGDGLTEEQIAEFERAARQNRRSRTKYGNRLPDGELEGDE